MLASILRRLNQVIEGAYTRMDKFKESIADKPENSRSLGKPRHRRKDNIKICLF
jgi:hypothetical protein